MIRVFVFPSVFFLLFSFVGCNEAPNNSKTKAAGVPDIIFKTVDAKTFKDLIDKKEGVLIDVNTPREYKEGHIAGAKNMDFFDPSFEDEIARLDKSKTYLIYSRTEHRSSKAMDKFRSQLIFKTINLKGGTLAWEKESLPLEK